MRSRLFVLPLLATLTLSAQALPGDVLVQWRGWARVGITVFDPEGRQKPDVVTSFPADPEPSSAAVPDDLLLSFSPIAVPMRSGEYLLIQRAQNPMVLKYRVGSDNVTLYSLPDDPYTYYPLSMELFRDQCTIAWTVSFKPEATEHLSIEQMRAIPRFDLCANQPLSPLLLTPQPADIPRFVRQLPSGDLLVVTYREGSNPTLSEILRYSPSGNLVRSYSIPPQTSLAGFNPAVGLRLTSDGRGFWIADRSLLLRYDLENSVPVVNTKAVYFLFEADPNWVVELRVEGEWRASLQPPPPRRRAASH